ncbi:hypothetical protein C0993_010220 [Termitomyces sp. T159_Od127]|nr:hypothetical protein C0993_010220 [Termitomyces sp. T159_Od127]
MYECEKLLVANRGEIAVRIIRTAKKLGIRTIAIYTPSDALSLHVSLADKAVPLIQGAVESSAEVESGAYLAAHRILSICLENEVTMLHPGYGFLSENAEFSSLIVKSGITWLGPRPKLIQRMGLKHEARAAAAQAGIPIVPGSNSVLINISDALEAAKQVGYPVILKATAGGGGLGMVVCDEEAVLQERFLATQISSKTLFGSGSLIIEKYIPVARHIEIQVFGDGLGNVIHLGERECSVQRRRQKIIEESPSPFIQRYSALRQAMCDAAVSLCKMIKYNSAGTVEFLVDQATAKFYFLEMNTRIQVEHPVTEAIYPGLDLVKLMIDQGISERPRIEQREYKCGPDMSQDTYDILRFSGLNSHAIEGRIYAENPLRNLLPSPGLLQLVELDGDQFDWLRMESWISTGLTITPFFDGLLCKVVVTGRTREEALKRFDQALDICKIYGPPNNSRALTVISPGIECTVQDLPGRTMSFGIPRGGPMDALALSTGNRIVDNPVTTEGLEVLIVPTIACELEFSAATVVAVTGKEVKVHVNDSPVAMWSRITIPSSGRLRLEVEVETETPDSGFRVYLSIRGGFPNVPGYLGSKSTSMGLGGFQGRSLLPGDQLALGSCGPRDSDEINKESIDSNLIPKYSSDWIIHVLPGPQDDEEFLSSAGQIAFYSTKWHVDKDSNRLGIRLSSSAKLKYARENGGEGGSHPSNILDNGYTLGAINLNGDTPVILMNDGPDMGGFMSVCTVASAEMWKLGQVQPGNTIVFKRISWASSKVIHEISLDWRRAVHSSLRKGGLSSELRLPWDIDIMSDYQAAILYEVGGDNERAGDAAILVEFGFMKLDLNIRARMHAFQESLTVNRPAGLRTISPCIRSVMCHYDPELVSQSEFLSSLITAQKSSMTVTNMEFLGRRIALPIVLDDPWNREALERYMATMRRTAVYLPSNIEYIGKNNGLEPLEALQRLVQTDWLVFGVGFYLGRPFLVPIDPRCRLIAQKMNPSRTYTPRGAIGIAGPVAAIYPIESPGGYQLYGRTLPMWQTWGKGDDFSLDKPWLLQPFDQIHFEVISADEYAEIQRAFDSGTYKFKIEPVTFSMKEYTEFERGIADEAMDFRSSQAKASMIQERREQELLSEWQIEKEREAIHARSLNADIEAGTSETYVAIHSPLFASVWKIKCRPGDRIKSAGEVLLILEAMKIEIPITSGEANVGKVVRRYGKGVVEGGSVRLGDELLVLM